MSARSRATNFPEDFAPYLTSTAIIDCDHPRVREFACRAAAGARDPVDMAVNLYLAVRDGIRYDPYAPFHLPEHYQASQVIQRGKQFCIPKAALLAALARVCGLPSRLGFAAVKNHLATRQLLEYFGTNLFVYHAFVELYLEGRWVKATPAFNRELCERHGVPALEFNGREDSLFQPYNEEHQRYMEYVDFFGVFADVPLEEILAAWRRTYGPERMAAWIRRLDEQQGESTADFEREEVWNQ
jgi:transglutaminase-like putative cysteine protease